jgi:hypothetical protein
MQKGDRTMEKGIVVANRACDGAMHYLFQATYYVRKKVILFHKFPGLCVLLVKVKTNMTKKLYHDEKSCGEILFCISSVVQKKVFDRVRDSRFFGIMIDESTDISVTGHLVVFASLVEEELSLCVFFGLLHIEEGKKNICIIFEILTKSIKEWGFDFDKCVGFGSDGVSTMIGKQNGVAAQLKDKVNIFLTSIHCVAYRTNLAAINATKVGPCKIISKEIDALLKSVTMHFKKSCKKKSALMRLQEELADSTKYLKRYHKIRWLSR